MEEEEQGRRIWRRRRRTRKNSRRRRKRAGERAEWLGQHKDLSERQKLHRMSIQQWGSVSIETYLKDKDYIYK